MKKTVFFIIGLGLILISAIFLSMASAATYKAGVFEDKALIEINFGDVSNLEFKLPYDTRIFETNIKEYEIIDLEDYKILKVDKANNLEISYITNSVIDRTNKRNFFIFNNYFGELESISLSLPEGAVLGDLIVPDPDEITTDGRRIILEWRDFSEEEIIVDYSFIKEKSNLWIYLLIILIIAFLLFYLYKSRKFKRQVKTLKQKSKVAKKKSKEKRKKDITRNLFGEEKKIIEYLLNKKGHESWTKELSKELEISKVRLSRRLRNLEQKELIEKIPYGNENKIKLLKSK
jgi:DNA-binding MarR family transcriptional regulator